MLSFGSVMLIVALVILIIISALCSSADMSYSVVSKARLEKDIEEHNHKSSKIALDFANNYDKAITTILFTNNLVNIAASSIATVLAITLFPDNASATSIAAIIMTIIILIFGEILPKSISRPFAYSLSKFYAYPVNVLRYIFFPITWTTGAFARLCVKPFEKVHKNMLNDADEAKNEDALQEMVDTIEEEGVIDESQSELLKNAITFTETQAFEIMTPRVDVVGLDINEDISKQINEKTLKVTRLPVYKDNIDKVVGFINSKDLLKKVLRHEDIDVEELMYTPLFVPRSTPISEILLEFKKKHRHIAIVVDEYGGTEGILTIEDILEELVGEIFDEKDKVVEQVVRVSRNKTLIDGMLNIDDFFEMYDIDEDEEETDYATVGGWCIQKLGHFAKVGETFSTDQVKVRIIKCDRFSVEKIEVSKRRKKKQ